MARQVEKRGRPRTEQEGPETRTMFAYRILPDAKQSFIDHADKLKKPMREILEGIADKLKGE